MNYPKLYSRSNGPVIEISKSILQKHFQLIRWPKHELFVMDIGIGDGRMAKNVLIPLFPKPPVEFVGIDTSISALEHAKGLINSPAFIPVHMDIGTPNLPKEMENKFTNVFSSICLHNVKNIRQAFSNIFQMLKPGGQFFVSTFKESTIDSTFEKLDEGVWSHYNNKQAISPFYKYSDPIGALSKIIHDLGFENCIVMDEPDYFARFTEEALDALYTSVNRIIPLVNEKDRGAYIKEYLRLFKSSTAIKEVETNDKNRHFDNIFKLMVAVGTKPGLL